jgi:thiol peroxidase
MNQTKLDGTPVNLKGHVPEKGSKASDFTYVKADLSEGTLSDLGSKKKVIIALPSLGTGVCQKETKEFNQKLAGREDVVGLVISKDLPFAISGFCAAEGIENIEVVSDFRGNFSEIYNTLIVDGPFKGLSARVVFVLDGQNNIKHTEVVDDIGHQPDFVEVMRVVDSL